MHRGVWNTEPGTQSQQDPADGIWAWPGNTPHHGEATTGAPGPIQNDQTSTGTINRLVGCEPHCPSDLSVRQSQHPTHR